MKKNYVFSLALLSSFSLPSSAELIGLDESSLESVDAQSGIGINIDALIHAGSITYSDDNGTSGGDLVLTDVRIGDQSDVANVAAHSEHQIDIDGTDGLFIFSRFENTRVQVGGISVGNHLGSRSFGQFIYDFEGTNQLNINGASTNGYMYNNTLDITAAGFQWIANGQAFRMDGITYKSVLSNMKLEELEVGLGNRMLQLDIASFNYNLNIAAMCFSNSACDTSVTGNSFGSVASNRTIVNSWVQLQGGGREGAGLNANAHIELDATLPGDGNFVTYTDDSTVKFAQQTGSLDITNFTFDIGRAETYLGDHIAMQWDSIIGNFTIGNVEIAGVSAGSFGINFTYVDGNGHQNKLLLAPGNAFAGYDFTSAAVAPEFSSHTAFAADLTSFFGKVSNTSDGISAFTEWNMTADMFYTEDGGTVMIDGYTSYGAGYVTLDLRPGSDSVSLTGQTSESFLAIGVRDYKVNYSMAGLKVGNGTSQLQNGYEFLGFSPEASFTMNAGIEIHTGGAIGSGLTFNGDVLLTDGSFAVSKSDVGGRNVGIYLNNASYEFHFRDVTFDVDSGGIKLVTGEMWSEFEVGDVVFGESTSTDSIGRLAIKQYQEGSELTISAGGSAVQKCMSGTGVDAVSCAADGGYWLDTGTQGLTFASKQILLQENGNKENSVTWETNRTAGQKNTGTAMILNNIYTSDGYLDPADAGFTNTHGVVSTTSIDVAQDRVTDSLVLSNNLQIKELNIDSVQMQHSNALATPSTLVNGIKFQNINFNSTLSVSPIR